MSGDLEEGERPHSCSMMCTGRAWGRTWVLEHGRCSSPWGSSYACSCSLCVLDCWDYGVALPLQALLTLCHHSGSRHTHRHLGRISLLFWGRHSKVSDTFLPCSDISCLIVSFVAQALLTESLATSGSVALFSWASLPLWSQSRPTVNSGRGWESRLSHCAWA